MQHAIVRHDGAGQRSRLKDDCSEELMKNEELNPWMMAKLKESCYQES